MTNSKFKSACQAVGACSLIAILIMLPFLMLHHLGEHYDREVNRNTVKYRLFKKAQKANDQKVLKKMNNLLVKIGKAWVRLYFRTRIHFKNGKADDHYSLIFVRTGD